jgi:hypothetical protein
MVLLAEIYGTPIEDLFDLTTGAKHQLDTPRATNADGIT